MNELAGRLGLTEQDLSEIINIITQCKEVESIKVYGSRAKGTFRPFSDVDIALYGKGITNRAIYSMQDKFYYSNLPYFFDLLIYPRLQDDALKSHIDRRAITIYNRGI